MKSRTPQRNAEATAERILLSAQKVFQNKGFEGASTREIADGAGVNLALIKRYFGSKTGLFEQAVLPFLTFRRFLKESPDTLASRLAGNYAHMQTKEEFDPFIVLVRSATSPVAGPLLAEAINKQVLKPLSGQIKGPDSDAHAILIASQIAGLILWFRVLDQQPEKESDRTVLADRLEKYIQNLLGQEIE